MERPASKSADPVEDVTTIYAATKLAGEQLVRAYGRQFGLSGDKDALSLSAAPQRGVGH